MIYLAGIYHHYRLSILPFRRPTNDMAVGHQDSTQVLKYTATIWKANAWNTSHRKQPTRNAFFFPQTRLSKSEKFKYQKQTPLYSQSYNKCTNITFTRNPKKKKQRDRNYTNIPLAAKIALPSAPPAPIRPVVGGVALPH